MSPSRTVLAEHRVPEDVEPERVDRYVSARFVLLPSRNSVRKALKRGELTVDGQSVEPSRYLRPGQRLVLFEPAHLPKVFRQVLRVVHRDDHLAAVEKPPGFPVSGNAHRTIANALPHNLPPSGAPDALRWPRPVHRLDRGTGGLLLVARAARAMVSLGWAFQRREVGKRYRAIVVGRLEGEGRLERPVEGRGAVTRWRAVEHTRTLHGGWVTTVDAWPETGRRHQIRRHLAHLGHPVLGDAVYGLEGSIYRNKGLFLWAVELRLTHPFTGERLHLEVDEPHKFYSYRHREARRWARWHGG